MYVWSSPFFVTIYLVVSCKSRCRYYSRSWAIRQSYEQNIRVQQTLRGESKKKTRAKETRSFLVRSILPSSITWPRVYLVICRETRDSRKASHAAGTINLCPANQALSPQPFIIAGRTITGFVRPTPTRGVKEKTAGNTFARSWNGERRGQPYAFSNAQEANRNTGRGRRRLSKRRLCTQTLNST